jgi:hypothetical protein
MKASKMIISLAIMISFGLFPAHDTFAASRHLLNSHRERVEFVIGILVTDILIGLYLFMTDSKVPSHHPELSRYDNNSSGFHIVMDIPEEQGSSPGELVILECRD